MNKNLENLGYLILAILLIFAGLVYQAFVASVLWGWFITPLFLIPVPSLIYCVGLLVFWRFLTAKFDGKEKTSKEALAATVSAALTHPTGSLLMGWIIVQFTGA